jgi:CRP-like cAMP-binding protein
MFSVLPMVVVDQLAAEIEHHAYEAGEVVMREGEAGDRFHVIVSGTARVTVAGTPRATLHRGEGMGEIALLRGVPRTATVTAAEPLRTVSLARDPFLDAVTGNQLSAESAQALADRRLAGDPT